MSPIRRFVGLAVLPLICLGLARCGNEAGDDSDAHAPLGDVGTVEGTVAYVAALVSDAGAVVYVCDGASELALWFEGAIDSAGTVALVTPRGDSLDARLRDDGVTGTFVTADGERHAFAATVVDGDAGLYRALSDDASAAGIHAGWIVDRQGDERGALRRGETFEPAPALDRSGLRIDGLVVPIYRFETRFRPGAPSPVPIPYPILNGPETPSSR